MLYLTLQYSECLQNYKTKKIKQSMYLRSGVFILSATKYIIQNKSAALFLNKQHRDSGI